MRAITAVTVLAICLLLGTCSRPQPARYYGAYPPPTPLLPHPKDVVELGSPPAKKPADTTKISSVKKPSLQKPPTKAKAAELKASLPKATKTVIAEPEVSITEPDPPAKKLPAAPPSPVTVEEKFKAAQEKANRDGVQTLTQEDIEGLSNDQIKELRGY